MNNIHQIAHSASGIHGRCTPGSESETEKSINANSLVSFTVSHGINEIYYPRQHNACIMDPEARTITFAPISLQKTDNQALIGLFI